MAKTGIRADRLLKLADRLARIRHKRFDMRRWPTCAISEAVEMKLVRGLRMSEPSYGYPIYRRAACISAVEAVFNLDRDEAIFLFGSKQPRRVVNDPKQVAKRIRSFVREQAGAA